MSRAERKVREQERILPMQKFNQALPLELRLLDDGRVGVVSEDWNKRLWIGHSLRAEMQPFDYANRSTLVSLPDVPSSYGRFVCKSIGGVSGTVRRQGEEVVRAKRHAAGPIILFAMSSDEEAFASLDAFLSSSDGDRRALGGVGEREEVDGERVAEVVVFDPSQLDFVCARMARLGFRYMLEDASVHSHQPIGIERLDRIASSVTNVDEEDERWRIEDFGLGRGDENWKFEWLPSHWTPPTTWDYMVLNVLHERVVDLPQPLRQHVAEAKLNLMRQREERGMPPNEECTRESNVQVCRCERCFLTRQVKWYHAGARKVTASLSKAQSEQLVTAFYLVVVERVDDPVVRCAAALVMFRYLVECGYMARWIGTYNQKADFVGNGTRTRSFLRLAQYDPSRIPTKVLNRILTKEGDLKGRGSKGSRSKYVRKKERYVPKQRMRKRPSPCPCMHARRRPRTCM